MNKRVRLLMKNGGRGLSQGCGREQDTDGNAFAGRTFDGQAAAGNGKQGAMCEQAAAGARRGTIFRSNANAIIGHYYF